MNSEDHPAGSIPLDLISVIIPCYNHTRYLGEAIESVLAQTYPHHEIVVVDDGSPEDVAGTAARYAGVRYVRQDNRGLPAARNTGIRASRGPYLVFLDADDHLLPHHFETALEAFRRRPEVGMVTGDYRWFGAPDTWHVHECSPNPDHYAAMLRTGFIGPPHNVMIRREVVLNVGGFREELKSVEDLELWLRVTRSYPIHCHCQVVAEYRRHADQMSRKWDVMLSYVMAVMREQWPHVRGNPVYEEAYYSGIRRHQWNCGNPLRWDLAHAVKRGDWPAAWRYLRVLLRWYPQGLLELLGGKLRKVVTRS